METRTLLTVIALMLAGIAAIMLARAGAGGGDENIFSNSTRIENRQPAARTDYKSAKELEDEEQISYRDAQI